MARRRSDSAKDTKPAASDRRRRQRSTQETAAQPAPRKDRPTPSARQAAKPQKASRSLVDRIPVVRSVVAYLRGVVAEMQKVTWPTREETRNLTLLVLGVTVAFAIGLGALDAFFSWWFRQAFHPDSEGVFLAVAAAMALVSGGGYLALRRHI